MEVTDQVFALDIGTRTVIGLLMGISEKGYKIKHCLIEEHNSRSMLDGQIHDIDQVAKVVRTITQKLGKKSGMKLKKVAVAAAGRALKTMNMKASREVSPLVAITPELVHELELEAVQGAQMALIEKEKQVAADYHCAGYSVVEYLLDGSPISNPAGQYGSQVAVEVIATFLPRVVVDSLFSVLEAADLEMNSLTLEPIAAINICIPPGMRKLNLALVDIGAGTSDIAITSGGTITAYAMVPVAGDEVTEKLCDAFLLDFHTGEKLKRELISRDRVQFRDILGKSYTLPSAQVIEAIAGMVDSLARDIVSTILEANRKPPQAVVCVGGGSLTPGLTSRIAQMLEIPETRVGIRGPEMIDSIQGLKKLTGPECVTPVGIAVTSLSRQSLSFSDIYVNNRPVRLFEITGGQVGDALVAAGINIRHLAGRPGLALTVEVNGKLQILKGTMGKPATILVNNQPAVLQTPLRRGDRIEVIPPVDGEPGRGLVKDVIPPLQTKRIRFCGRLYEAAPVITKNGQLAEPETPLEDGCKINYQEIKTVRDLLAWLGIEPADGKMITFTFNGQTVTRTVSRHRVMLNGQESSLDAVLHSGDEVDYREEERPSLKIADVLGEVGLVPGGIEIYVNGQKLVLAAAGQKLRLNGREATPETEIRDGDAIVCRSGNGVQPILADVLPLINLPSYPAQQSATLVTTVNGQAAEFTTPLKEGDKIRVYWRENQKDG